MTAKQIIFPAHRAFNSDGAPEPGATAYLYLSSTTTPANFYSDVGLSVSLGSHITANAAGRFVPHPYQDSTVAFRLVIEDAEGTVLDDIDPFFFGLQTGVDGTNATVTVGTTTTGASGSDAAVTNSGTTVNSILNFAVPAGIQGPAGDVAKVLDRTALAAVAVPVAGMVRYLTESGREGTFAFNSANLSSYVTADTAKGIYVAPTSDTTGASGAWVRKFDGPILPQWFGAVADDDTGTGTDNSAAFTVLIAVLHARAKVGITNATIYRGSDEILIAGRFYVGAFTFEPLATVKLRGIGGIGWGAPSRMRFAAGVTALRAQSFNTSGTSTVDGGNHFSGDNWVVQDIYFLGPWNISTTTEGEFYGLHVKRPIQMTNCTIDGFQGEAAWIDSTTGLPDMCRFVNVKFLSSRVGLKATGGDANACTFTGCEFNNNRTWGVNDTSFLGNYYWGCHAANNGITSLASTLGASVVSYLGNRYAVIDGQEVGASTNAPSGTATDNTWWYYMAVGGTSGTGIPAWVSGMAIRAGGAYRTHNANATNHVDACYSESGQGPSQFTYPTMVNGGALSSGVRGNPAYTYNFQGWWRVGGRDSSRGIIVDGDSTVNGGLTVDGGAGSGVFNLQGTGASPTINLKEGGVTYGYLLASGSSVYLNGSNGVILRANGADTATVNTTGLNIASGKNIQYAGTPVLTTGILTAAAHPALTGDVTNTVGTLATTISANVVTYAKFQQVAASSLVGNATGVLANATGITLAGGLTFSGSTLTVGALTPTSVAATGAISGSNLSGTNTGDETSATIVSKSSGQALTPASVVATGGVSGTTIVGSTSILSTGTGGVGYNTGAGGAVTQLTSRTTGVTINKPCGAITLFSAAGSATWATFTVTNSTVAATDVIDICQKSGANLYSAIATAVGAGTFNVSISAVSGTATEAPVFNFTVTKAVPA